MRAECGQQIRFQVARRALLVLRIGSSDRIAFVERRPTAARGACYFDRDEVPVLIERRGQAHAVGPDRAGVRMITAVGRVVEETEEIRLLGERAGVRAPDTAR